MKSAFYFCRFSLAIVLIVAACHASFAEEAKSDRDHQTGIGEVEKLLRQRLQVLIEAARLQQEAYKAGEVRFDAVASLQLDVLAARLELAKKSDERIKIRRETLEMAAQIEKFTTRLLRANEATQVDVLKAKALRLRAEADLKREQSKVDD